MKNLNEQIERINNLSGYQLGVVINEQTPPTTPPTNTTNKVQPTDDGKSNLIQVLMNHLEHMKKDSKFDANAVCDTIINNCNNFKNKKDVFAK